MTKPTPSAAIPFAVACLGIALFSAMDAAMKGLAIALGAYCAMLWRQAIGGSLSFVPYLVTRKAWPSRAGLRIHILRGLVAAIMATSFFYGLARVPLAEAIALSFIAPLIALYLAVVLLGETVGRHSIIASLFGIAGVAVLLAARIGDASGERHLDGVASILLSAVFYAWNTADSRIDATPSRCRSPLASPIRAASKTATPAIPNSDAMMLCRPTVSPRRTTARYSAISGAMNDSAIASASGTRARP